jgi:UDPglucose--hexose-1-phosphate uridylyltransferase
MSEFRQDPIVDRWVIVATERAAKPQELIQQARTGSIENCPFCERHEEDTTQELLAYRAGPDAANGPGWRVRVIPNKYPAVTGVGEVASFGGGFYRQVRGVGAHEVIVECPSHETNLARLSALHIGEVLRAYRDRLQHHKRDPRLTYALLFKNYGALAGASMEHCHSQLLATPVVPQLVAEELAGSLEFYRRNHACPYCALLTEELEINNRIITQSANFVVICPFASRFPFEMWLLPRKHAGHFDQQSTEELADLATILKAALGKLSAVLNDPAYNFYLHTAPLHAADLPHYHWHLEVFPRLAQLAGFEHGGGMFINPILPEYAAELLREAIAS